MVKVHATFPKSIVDSINFTFLKLQHFRKSEKISRDTIHVIAYTYQHFESLKKAVATVAKTHLSGLSHAPLAFLEIAEYKQTD